MTFINFSNHPSSGWGDEQKAQAGRYGQVVDLPFPAVAPAATTSDIERLARASVAHILDMGGGSDITVHIMGEMTLVYHIVRRLKRRGVRCVASTTERVVTEVDGKKVSEFHFVQFREY